jgi:hypothetical protein
VRIDINRFIPVTTKWGVLFGGFMNQFGWAFFGFGLIFFWIFAMNADLSFLHFSGEIITVEGKVTNSSKTGASVNEIPVYEVHYTFGNGDADAYNGISYSTGRALQSGETVSIEYPEGKPRYSRIKGMRRQLFGPVILFVLIFPVIGLVFIFYGMKKSLQAIRLLQYGRLAKGTLISKVPTRTSINNQIVYNVMFRFTDHLGREWDVSAKTHLPHLLEDEAEERLLYFPANPKNAVMLDSLPSAGLINDDDRIKELPLKPSLARLIIPLVTIVGHGLYIVIRFMP